MFEYVNAEHYGNALEQCGVDAFAAEDVVDINSDGVEAFGQP